jgi:hypothetical protein
MKFLSQLSADQVNKLNIGLMIVATLAALARPFEVFLLVYAFLGPLHYLTEISWLHDRNYFMRGKHGQWVLIAVAGIIVITDLQLISGIPTPVKIAVTYIGFFSALVFVLTANWWKRLGSFVLLAITSPLIVRIDFTNSFFLLFLPSVMHVFVFTGLFILMGALKGRSKSGIASLLVFCACAVSFFLIGPFDSGDRVSSSVRATYQPFALLNYAVTAPFNRHDISVPSNAAEFVNFINTALYHSPGVMAFMGFIAFAYTYHYLNWFSKTSIIQWHDIPRSRLVAIVIIWLISLGLFLYDYMLGLRWLYFLSFTHVLLEFPLNHLTMINLGKEFKARAGGWGSVRGAANAPN